MSRAQIFYSLGVMPALMGVGHLACAVGAIQTATGEYRFPITLLTLIGTISGLVDSIDTYKDVPLDQRPRKWIWNTWVYTQWAVVALCTYLSGKQAAVIIYRVLPLGLLWGAPCIPAYRKGGLILYKPKALLLEGKSLVVAMCMASVCAEASMAFYCTPSDSHCADESLRRKSFYLAILYQFFRETSCDVRDIAEDAKEGLETLPVRLGKRNTMLLMTLGGILIDSILTASMVFSDGLVVIDQMRFAYSVLRVTMTMTAYWQVLRYPRNNYLAWGSMSLLGLTPVLFAQASLRS